MKKTLKCYMTFRDGEPLPTSTASISDYNIYLKQAPLFEEGDKSVPVVITLHTKNQKQN